MSFYTPSKLPDVATETITSLGQSIDLVGMTNIQLPIMIEVQNEVKTVLSRCNVFVNVTCFCCLKREYPTAHRDCFTQVMP